MCSNPAATVIRIMMIALVTALLCATALCYARSGMALGGHSASSLLSNATSALSTTPQLANSGALQESAVVLSSLGAVDPENKGLYGLAFWLLAIVTLLVACTHSRSQTLLPDAAHCVRPTCAYSVPTLGRLLPSELQQG